MQTLLKSSLVAVATLIVAAAAVSADAAVIRSANSFDHAKQLSESKGLPILIKVGASWCKNCEAFDAACASDSDVQTSIADHAILLATDGEKGEGVEIARTYGVTSYPTFVLVNAQGEMLDRWGGYWKASYFAETMTKAVANPVTVTERLARFQKMPSSDDARKLAEMRFSEGLYGEAVAYYRRADALDQSGEGHYDRYVMKALSQGTMAGVFTTADVRAQADHMLAAADRTDKDVVSVAYSMRKLGAQTGDRDLALPYIKVAIEETSDASGEKVAKMRRSMMPDYALRIEKKEKKALAAMKESLGEGWEDDAQKLNHFAWWCFENEINLTEAEQLARKGVELAESGTPRANILDTVAEICNLKGDCADSVELMRLAIAEDPQNPYFQEQLQRFETLLAASND